MDVNVTLRFLTPEGVGIGGAQCIGGRGVPTGNPRLASYVVSPI